MHSEQSCKTFGEKLATTNWQELLGNETEWLNTFKISLSTLFTISSLFRTFRSRSNKHPWITLGILALSKRKKQVYKREGHSYFWSRLQDRSIELSKVKYVQRVRKGGAKAYFSAIKDLNCKENPKQWSVNDLFQDDEPEEVGRKVADYFTEITNRFNPLQPSPPTGMKRRPITLAEVEAKLHKAKKPSSSVNVDILPRLVWRFHKALALPMQLIYNKVFEDEEWPRACKCKTEEEEEEEKEEGDDGGKEEKNQEEEGNGPDDSKKEEKLLDEEEEEAASKTGEKGDDDADLKAEKEEGNGETEASKDCVEDEEEANEKENEIGSEADDKIDEEDSDFGFSISEDEEQLKSGDARLE